MGTKWDKNRETPASYGTFPARGEQALFSAPFSRRNQSLLTSSPNTSNFSEGTRSSGTSAKVQPARPPNWIFACVNKTVPLHTLFVVLSFQTVSNSAKRFNTPIQFSRKPLKVCANTCERRYSILFSIRLSTLQRSDEKPSRSYLTHIVILRLSFNHSVRTTW